MNRKHTLIQLLALVVLGGVIFFYQLGYPAHLVFDEAYYIPAAQKYLNGVLFEELHPPLGKLFIALGEKVWQKNEITNQYIWGSTVQGDEPVFNYFGYRFFPALFGLMSVLVLFLIFRWIIPDRLIAFALSLTALLDNASIIQARFALFNSTLIFFILLTLYLSLRILKSQKPVWAEFALLGLASAGAVLVKHTGWVVLLIILPIVLRTIKDRTVRELRHWLLFLFCFALVYISVWRIHYGLGKVTSGVNPGISQELLDWKSGDKKINPVRLTYLQIRDAWAISIQDNGGIGPLDVCKKDEIGSPWYYWPFGGRGISYRQEGEGDLNKHLFLLGNPVVWLVSLLGVVFSLAWMMGRWFFGVKVKSKTSRLIPYFTMIYVGYMAPFIFMRRVMYIYHYVPAMILGLILFGLVLSESRRVGKIRLTKHRKRMFSLALLGGVFLGFIIIAPITYFAPVTNYYMQRINLIPIWGTDFQQKW